ncbi:MAG: RNA-guided pseudouridylation complex pseudouridine synthase subunit Cbf5 [Candidatus Aenigmarchaeota archaeon]|nr:RNA-guided pseudouridylation complex pseudouridine synthase subunit Cbf5 [Candidatus Aenigmarchaeota archaeon]
MRLVALVDKPSGLTSFECVERLAKKFRVKKAGHTGTLDPKVTGLMIIALGEARKAIPVLMGMDKEYEGKMILHKYVSKDSLKTGMKKFTGEIVQTPPVRSRVARKPRKRRVYSFEFLRENSREIEFRVKCEAGTYIRKLIHDLGETIGTGAHMAELRRISVGPFGVKESLPMDKITRKDLIPIESVLERIVLKKAVVSSEAVEKIRNGVPVGKEMIIKSDDFGRNETFGIYDEEGSIIALGKKSGSNINADRVFSQ